MTTKIYEFEVRGMGPFPLDMLRYDGCWPASPDAVMAIEHSLDERDPNFRTSVKLIRLRSWKPMPTIDRWRSFQWGVDETSIKKVT
jgi:hypothetical protein